MRLGLIINESKTKYMVTGKKLEKTSTSELASIPSKKSNTFIYLGCQVNFDGETTEEVKRRITLGNWLSLIHI